MRTVVQRVSRASVAVGGRRKAAIGTGLLVLVGIEEADTREDADWLSRKIAGLRVFDDERGVMNRSVADVGGGLLVVSQFTLHASTRKGNRPSYARAAGRETALPLYEYFCRRLGLEAGREAETGEFGADMQVELLNDGPVTICIDTRNKE